MQPFFVIMADKMSSFYCFFVINFVISLLLVNFIKIIGHSSIILN